MSDRDFDKVRSHKKNKKQQNGEFKLNEITPKTDNQIKTFEAYGSGSHLLLHGAAGTGKTFLSCFIGIRDVLERRFSRVVIVRSIVPTRDIGFLPGTLAEKMQVYEAPYKEIFNELFGRGDAYELLKKKGYVEFTSTSFVRGLTLENAFVIIDEAQNLTDHELRSVITRLGKNSALVIAGDFAQNDLVAKKNEKEQSGIQTMIKVAKNMKSFAIIEFGIRDIVRSGLVREYLIARINAGLE
jgi:phosphate starvation-inducible protein PhoH